MSVFEGSRYEGLKAFVYRDESGRERRMLEFPVFLSELDVEISGLVLLQCRPELDMLDVVVKRFGGQERDWHLIAQISDVKDPISMTIDTNLKVPVSELIRRQA